jgi:hypothetical protein
MIFPNYSGTSADYLLREAKSRNYYSDTYLCSSSSAQDDLVDSFLDVELVERTSTILAWPWSIRVLTILLLVSGWFCISSIGLTVEVVLFDNKVCMYYLTLKI